MSEKPHDQPEIITLEEVEPGVFAAPEVREVPTGTALVPVHQPEYDTPPTAEAEGVQQPQERRYPLTTKRIGREILRFARRQEQHDPADDTDEPVPAPEPETIPTTEPLVPGARPSPEDIKKAYANRFANRQRARHLVRARLGGFKGEPVDKDSKDEEARKAAEEAIDQAARGYTEAVQRNEKVVDITKVSKEDQRLVDRAKEAVKHGSFDRESIGILRASGMSEEDIDTLLSGKPMTVQQEEAAPRPARQQRQSEPGDRPRRNRRETQEPYVDPAYAPLFDKETLVYLDRDIAEEIRQIVRAECQTRGVKQLPKDDFSDITRSVRTRVMQEYAGEDVPPEVMEALDKARREAAHPKRK